MSWKFNNQTVNDLKNNSLVTESFLYGNHNDCISLNTKLDLEVILYWKWWIQGVMTIVLSLFGISGNIMAILILLQKKQSFPFNQLLIALCLLDTAFIGFVFPQSFLDIFGFRFLLKITPYTECLVHTFMCGSIFLIVSIAFERHFAICKPHQYRIHIRSTPRWRHLSMYIGPVALLSIILNIPMFLNLKKSFMNKPDFLLINIYLRAFHPLATTGILPMIALCFLNIRICRGLARLHQRRTSRNRGEVNMTYISITIMVLFFILNLPRIVTGSLEIYDITKIVRCVKTSTYYIPSVRFYKMDIIARFLMVVNSSINFLIYCGVSTSFQIAFKDFIFRKNHTVEIVELDSSSHNNDNEIQPTLEMADRNIDRKLQEKSEV